MTAHEFHQKLRLHQKRLLWPLGALFLAAMGLVAAFKGVVEETTKDDRVKCIVIGACGVGVVLGLLIFLFARWLKKDREKLGLNCPHCRKSLLKGQAGNKAPGTLVLATGACPSCHQAVLTDPWPSPVYRDPATGEPMKSAEALRRWVEVSRRSTPWAWVGVAVAVGGMAFLLRAGTSWKAEGHAGYGLLLELSGYAWTIGVMLLGMWYLHRQFKAVGLVCTKCGVIPHKAGDAALYCARCIREGSVPQRGSNRAGD